MKNKLILSCLCVIFAASNTKIKAQKMSKSNTAPTAKIIPKTLEKHGEKRVDNYFWLNDRENPEVIDYLNQENTYYDAMTSDTKGFQKELYEEMKSRIKEDDQSVPYLYNGYYYITRLKQEKAILFIPEKKRVFLLQRKFCSIAMSWLKGIRIFNWEV